MPSGYNALAARPQNRLAYPGQDVVNAFTQGLGPMLYGAAKGTAAAVAGMPGDIEQLARQLLLSGAAPDSYTAKNMAAQALLPTSDRVRAMLPSLPSAGPQAQYSENMGATLGQNVVGNLVAPKALPAVTQMAGQGAAATGQFVAPKAGQLAEQYMVRTGGIIPIAPFDPRFDPRILEQARLQAMTTDIVPTSTAAVPKVSLADFEGRPFITSMADRTAAGGNLVGINDIAFNRPVELKGGQDFMFNNPGQVWASAQAPVKAIMSHAQEIKNVTGQNPLFLPWRMAPTGGDFAAMTGETMLAYADSAMNKTQKRLLDKSIKQYIPDWSGVSDPSSVDQFRNAPDTVRKALKNMMDVNFRDAGGLNIGQARLAVSDPKQLVAPDAGIMNVGEVFADQPMVMQSGHPSYPRGVPGQGLGQLEDNRNIFELLPQVAQQRNIANAAKPGQTDIRALQMKPYAGIIDNALLKRLGY